jgi:hypothetical protein
MVLIPHLQPQAGRLKASEVFSDASMQVLLSLTHKLTAAANCPRQELIRSSSCVTMLTDLQIQPTQVGRTLKPRDGYYPCGGWHPCVHCLQWNCTTSSSSNAVNTPSAGSRAGSCSVTHKPESAVGPVNPATYFAVSLPVLL